MGNNVLEELLGGQTKQKTTRPATISVPVDDVLWEALETLKANYPGKPQRAIIRAAVIHVARLETD